MADNNFSCIGEKVRSWEIGSWLFCSNGYKLIQSTGVDISVEQPNIIKVLVSVPEMVKHCEKERTNKNISNNTALNIL